MGKHNDRRPSCKARAELPKAAKAAKPADEGRGVDTKSLLAMEAQHKARILGTVQRRMREDEQRKLSAERKKQEKMLQERKVDDEILRRKSEREEEYQARVFNSGPSCRRLFGPLFTITKGY